MGGRSPARSSPPRRVSPRPVHAMADAVVHLPMPSSLGAHLARPGLAELWRDRHHVGSARVGSELSCDDRRVRMGVQATGGPGGARRHHRGTTATRPLLFLRALVAATARTALSGRTTRPPQAARPPGISEGSATSPSSGGGRGPRLRGAAALGPAWADHRADPGAPLVLPAWSPLVGRPARTSNSAGASPTSTRLSANNVQPQEPANAVRNGCGGGARPPWSCGAPRPPHAVWGTEPLVDLGLGHMTPRTRSAYSSERDGERQARKLREATWPWPGPAAACASAASNWYSWLTRPLDAFRSDLACPPPVRGTTFRPNRPSPPTARGPGRLEVDMPSWTRRARLASPGIRLVRGLSLLRGPPGLAVATPRARPRRLSAPRGLPRCPPGPAARGGARSRARNRRASTACRYAAARGGEAGRSAPSAPRGPSRSSAFPCSRLNPGEGSSAPAAAWWPSSHLHTNQRPRSAHLGIEVVGQFSCELPGAAVPICREGRIGGCWDHNTHVRPGSARSLTVAWSTAFPAWPTKGSPLVSRWRPGASPRT